MVRSLFQYYQMGKNLGLTKKEINNILLFDNSKHPLLYSILLILGLVGLAALIVFLGSYIAEHVYPAGTLYSTVKKEDFKTEKNSKNPGVKKLKE